MAILPSVASSLSPPSLSPLCSARSNDDDDLISTSICRQSHASSRRPLHLNSRFRLTAISASSNSEAASSSSSSLPSSSLVSREPMVPPYNVLITGSTKGIGYALAKEFVKAGDNVIICSRSGKDLSDMIRFFCCGFLFLSSYGKIEIELLTVWGIFDEMVFFAAERVESALQNLRGEFGELHVWGTKCDVRQGDDVKNLVSFAKEKLDYIDIWINNAGSNAYSYKPLSEASDDDLIEVVTTNTLGLMICCREAIKMMLNQPRGGHIFNIDGAGSDGRPTPRPIMDHVQRSLSSKEDIMSFTAELQMQDIKNVIVHNLSPGMVTTDLLMSGANTKQAKFFINVLAEPAEVVAESLVPSIRSIPANGSTKPTYIRFLTGLKAYSQIFSVKDSHLVQGGIAMCLKIDETYRSDMSVIHFP
ncbi:hypothetical protein RHSIM_Rhsim04G0167800 [Rhododendron simsii]|uniref:Chlorophyll(Ide) b reductase NOL, chloroplastic n=1 Tax=Rhododendron simsii TaxID=118357 RepID=A0A834H5L6_RHOSS|nr:hypothetical protein RHSIM_Rhsim04G0167800 [Rhododendron simsii]